MAATAETKHPENWSWMAKDAQEVAEEPYVSDFKGRQTGWLRKMKNDSAKGKWLSDSNWRFFTVDFDDQTVFYSNSESSKTVSNPIGFGEIVDVKLLQRSMKRGLTERLLGNQAESEVGLCLITSDREMRLLCKELDHAKHWVAIFTAARKVAQVPLSLMMVKSPSRASSLGSGSDRVSTALGSDTSEQKMSDTDSDGSSNRMRPWENHAPVRERIATPPWAQPTPEPGSKQDAFFEPDGEDAFAALDLLVDDMYVPESDAPKVDVATAIKAAKAKRAQKANGEAPQDTSSGYAQVQQPVAAKPAKEMTAEDRTANDIALLKRQQMFGKSVIRKAKAEDAAPLKATRALKRPSAGALADLTAIEGAKSAEQEATPKPVVFKMTCFTNEGVVSKNVEAAPQTTKQNAWEDDANSWDGSGDEAPVTKSSKAKAKSSKEKEFIPEPAPHDDDPWDSDGEKDKSSAPKGSVSVPGPSEGTVDQGSWDDDDEPPKTVLKKKKSKAVRKQEVDEEDPTAGLDDLVDGVLTGKAVSLKVHQYVEGFQCTQCDFKVIRFTDFEWAPEADYLFFRNYYGKPKKLPRMLHDNHGVSAYCCQCAFKSVASDTALRDVADGTRWKCVSA